MVALSEELGEKLIHEMRRVKTNHRPEQAVARMLMVGEIQEEGGKRYEFPISLSLSLGIINIAARFLCHSRTIEGQEKRQRVNSMPIPNIVDIVIAPCLPNGNSRLLRCAFSKGI